MDQLGIPMSSLGDLEVFGLDVGFGLEVVEACACVVDIGQLWEVLELFSGHL